MSKERFLAGLVCGLEGEFWFYNYQSDTVPQHVQAAADEALRLVRDMLRGTGEVTV